MKKKREARTTDGILLTHCPGCGASPVRSTWLEECDCGLKTCRCCREEGTCTVCTRSTPKDKPAA